MIITSTNMYVHCLYMFKQCIYMYIPIQNALNLYIHCLYTSNTCTYNVNTCQIHDMYMFYDLHTVHQQHIYNFLPFCPMLVDRNLQFCI